MGNTSPAFRDLRRPDPPAAPGTRERPFETRFDMTSNADLILFTYSLVLVGFVTGLQMLYVGGLRRRAMRLGGAPLKVETLRAAGAVFSIAGVLAFAVMAAEILSGAAGTDIRAFIIATIVIPPVVLAYNAWRDARSPASS